MRRAWIVFLPAVLTGCAPIFSDLQGARLVPKGDIEVTPGLSTVSFDGGNSSGHSHDHAGVQVAAGVSDRLELRGRYERLFNFGDDAEFEDGDERGTANVVGFGPKVQLVKDRLAAYVPFGFAFGGDIDAGETWAVHPTLLLTLPVHRNVEVNGSAKLLIPLTAENGDTLAAFNLGLGIGHLDRWAIRPEVGILVNPGEDGHFTQLSIGVSFRPGK